MKFDLFKELYSEALECPGIDYYIAERGYQKWMDDYSAEEVRDILSTIHNLANKQIKETRQMTQAEYSRRFMVPLKTLQNWDSEKEASRTSPAYVKLLLDYAWFNSDRDDTNE